MSPVRSEGVVEGSRMWGTFVSSEKKHTVFAAVKSKEYRRLRASRYDRYA